MDLYEDMRMLSMKCNKLIGRELYVRGTDGTIKKSTIRNVAIYNLMYWSTFKDKKRLGNILLSDPDYKGFIDISKLGVSCFIGYREAELRKESLFTTALKREIYELLGYIKPIVGKKVWIVSSEGIVEECMVSKIYVCSCGDEFGFRDKRSVFIEGACINADGVCNGYIRGRVGHNCFFSRKDAYASKVY